MRNALCLLALSTISLGCAPAADSGSEVGNQANLGNSASASGTSVNAQVMIGGKAMSVTKVEAWNLVADERFYNVFVSFNGPGYDQGSNAFFMISTLGAGCRNDAALAMRQVALLRPTNANDQFLANDGVGCGLTVSAVPGTGSRVHVAFRGAMNALNPQTTGAVDKPDVAINFDVTLAAPLTDAVQLGAKYSVSGMAIDAFSLDGILLPKSGVDLELLGPAAYTVTTASDGSFSFAGLAPGTYSLSRVADGSPLAQVTVTNSDVDLGNVIF